MPAPTTTTRATGTDRTKGDDPANPQGRSVRRTPGVSDRDGGRPARTAQSARCARRPARRAAALGCRRARRRLRPPAGLAGRRRRRQRHRRDPALAQGVRDPPVRHQRQAGAARLDPGRPRPALPGHRRAGGAPSAIGLAGVAVLGLVGAAAAATRPGGRAAGPLPVRSSARSSVRWRCAPAAASARCRRCRRSRPSRPTQSSAGCLVTATRRRRRPLSRPGRVGTARQQPARRRGRGARRGRPAGAAAAPPPPLPRGQRPEDRRPQPLHHAQQGLLPGRHRVDRAAGRHRRTGG